MTFQSIISFLKKPRTYIVLAILIGAWFFWGRDSAAKTYYETVNVIKTNLTRTVDVTGEVKPDLRLSLGFKSSGPLEKLSVRIGQKVKRGDVLASLESRDLRFAVERAGATVALAQSNLDARLAGETKESIAIAQASLIQAQAQYDKALLDVELTKQRVEDEYRLAQIAYDKAKSDLSSAGSSADQSVVTSREALLSGMKASVGTMRSALSAGDEIIGVDNAAANDNYENVLGISDVIAKDSAKYLYEAAKTAFKSSEQRITALTTTSPSSTYLEIGGETKAAVEKTQAYLDAVQRVLNSSITNAFLTESVLASKRSTIDAQRSSVSGQLTSVSSLVEGYRSALYGITTQKTQIQSAYQQAEANLSIAERNRISNVKTAETNLAIQKAAVTSAQANLDLRKAGPRAVDVAGLRAQLQDAQTAYNQANERLSDAQIIAPADGVITDIVPTTGELVAQNAPVIKMVSTEGFGVEALVPESDIALIEVGQNAIITLDAYGENVPFTARVVGENADQTKIQDAVYYKMYLTIETADKEIKPGMTANVTVTTDTRNDVLAVPSRSLRDQQGKKEARKIDGSNIVSTEVIAGLRADAGLTEVAKGLSADDRIILREVSAEEFAKLEESKRFVSND